MSQNPDPQLFENIWYLTSLTIEGSPIEFPENSEFTPPDLNFDLNSGDVTLFTCNCYCHESDGVLFVSGFFTLPNGLPFLIDVGCPISENMNFHDIYFDDFFQHEIPEVSNPIAYEILTDSDGNKQLTLTNSNGDIAVYGDQLLLTLENTAATFSLVTNPVQNNLELQFPNATQNRAVQIYDITGKLVKSTTSNQETNLKFDVSVLEGGMYLVVVAEGTKKSIRKFIKR
ncbi:hypothetical protein ULMA_13020 [Patiriisocius marinus]|uniref:Secretion system C-terminal sorting domain-containing protein n=1 Tax=Patiriisocius marinus TaxID=1397112 RepID=A0A5J4IW51_9FLAO|nr:hypothetical protein ULMA_13020 [Patiriisocius marinus]